MPLNDPRLLPPIIEALRESGQLRIFRPDRCWDFWDASNDWYVHETAIAVPVIVPVKKILEDSPLRPIHGPQQFSKDMLPDAITVWILDPVNEPGSKMPHLEPEYRESIVFIVQELSEFHANSFITGISALRMAIEIAPTIDEFDYRFWSYGKEVIPSPEHDPSLRHLGHPIKRLAQVGGIVNRPRKIETIYKIAYASDEHYLLINNDWRRIDDILAYPLFIAE